MGFSNKNFITAEAVAWRCSVKNMFLKILQDSQNFRKISQSFFKETYLLKRLLLGQLYYYFPYFFSKFFHVLLLIKDKIQNVDVK